MGGNISSNNALNKLETEIFNCLERAKETLTLITNEPDVRFELIKVSEDKINNINLGDSELLAKIGLTRGLPGYGIMGLSNKDCSQITSLMMGMDDAGGLADEICHSAICEAMNQTMGSVCIELSKSMNDTIDISTPEVIKNEDISLEKLLEDIYKDNIDTLKIEYKLSIGTINTTLSFIFEKSIAEDAVIKIQNTENDDFLRANPALAKKVAEYFTLLGTKYKSIYSMIGVMDEVAILGITSIHSLQRLDVDVITNYNIINKGNDEDLYNVFIFEEDFVADMKKVAGLLDDEESTWEILRELNNQFSYTFLEYCSDSDTVLDSIECNNFLELPDNKYILISYRVGYYKFYQLLSFELITKINFKLSKADKERIKDKSVENIAKGGYNPETNFNDDISSLENNDINKLPKAYRQLPFELSAVLGEKNYLLKELLHFGAGYIIHFDRKVSEDIDIYINNIKRAEGEVGQLTYNRSNNYAVKIKKTIKEE